MTTHRTAPPSRGSWPGSHYLHRLVRRLQRELQVELVNLETTQRGHWQRKAGVMAWHGRTATGHTYCSEDTVTQCLRAHALRLRRPPQTWWGQTYVDAIEAPNDQSQ